MFREMRRKRQALAREDIDAILRRGTSGVLALLGDEGYPYAVPISYVYDGARLLFHCAKSGHKLDALRQNPKASFCVIDQDAVDPANYTTYFRSVIVFGRLRELQDNQEKYAAIDCLARKYAPDDAAQNRQAAIAREWSPLCMLEMQIDHMTGKEAIELVRARTAADR